MAKALKGVSVLVVEDDPEMLDVLFLALGGVGATVRIAGSAEAALEILEAWTPDVILSDIQLPGADGFQFLEALRANPKLAGIPAAALSGDRRALSTDDRRAEFERYLTKPSKLPDIVLAIASLARDEHHERRAAPAAPAV